MVEITVSSTSLLLLFPLFGVLAFLLVFTAPWIASKLSASFFGGGQMDPRGPGGRYKQPTPPNQVGHTHQTSNRSDNTYFRGSYGSNPGINQASNEGSSNQGNYGTNQEPDYDQNQYFLRNTEQPQQQFAENPSDDDDNDNEEDEDDD